MAEFRKVDLQKYLKTPLRAPDKTDETLGVSKGDDQTVPGQLQPGSGTVARLPWQLERLVSAAASDCLDVAMPGVFDVNGYVMAWASSYLVGDRKEAKRRLWQVYGAIEDQQQLDRLSG